jgi:hypothetical protein
MTFEFGIAAPTQVQQLATFFRVVPGAIGESMSVGVY